MEKRNITGLILIILGFLISINYFLFSGEETFTLLIFGGFFFLVGLIIILNKKEDEIEKIKYK